MQKRVDVCKTQPPRPGTSTPTHLSFGPSLVGCGGKGTRPKTMALGFDLRSRPNMGIFINSGSVFASKVVIVFQPPPLDSLTSPFPLSPVQLKSCTSPRATWNPSCQGSSFSPQSHLHSPSSPQGWISIANGPPDLACSPFLPHTPLALQSLESRKHSPCPDPEKGAAQQKASRVRLNQDSCLM